MNSQLLDSDRLLLILFAGGCRTETGQALLALEQVSDRQLEHESPYP